MQPKLCGRCGKAPLAECVNGNVLLDEYTARECPNLKLVRIEESLKARLTPELYNAPRIAESPLFTPGKARGDAPVVNRTKENLFIRGVTYSELLPHLRLAFKYLPRLRYKITTDSRLRDVFVGGEAYKNKPKSTRDSKESYNIVTDLVGEEFDLVVIRLGILAYKNIAAPAILREALMVRDGLGKATWLFEDSDPTINWECSKDLDVETYISSRYKDFCMAPGGPTAETDDVNSGIVVDGPEEDRIISEPMELVPQEDQLSAGVSEPVEVPLDDDFGMLGGGTKKKKGKWKGGRW